MYEFSGRNVSEARAVALRIRTEREFRLISLLTMAGASDTANIKLNGILWDFPE